MLRSVIAVIAGIIAAVVMIYAVEAVGNLIHPMPPGMDPNNHEQMEAFLQNMPVSAFLVVLFAWAMGSFTGGFVTAIINKSRTVTPAFLVSIFLLSGGIVELFSMWHPVWMMIAGICLFIPATLLGHLAANKLNFPNQSSL